jgi:hypothetical protein
LCSWEKEWIHEFLTIAKVKENELAITILRRVKEMLGITYQGLELNTNRKKHMQQPTACTR